MPEALDNRSIVGKRLVIFLRERLFSQTDLEYLRSLNHSIITSENIFALAVRFNYAKRFYNRQNRNRGAMRTCCIEASRYCFDGNIITGEGPAATLPYAYRILSFFKDENTVSSIENGMRYTHLMNK